jgi:hypothetical protein
MKGRSAEVSTLARTVIATRPTRIALVGSGGSGKSLLAVALGHRLSREFGGRIDWFRSGAWGFYTLSEMLALRFGTTKRSTFIDLDAMPSATQLEVAVANAMGGAGAHAQLIAAAFPDLATLPDGNKANLNLLYGYQPGQSLHISKRGLYLRLRFGVWGIRKPWEVLGWVLRFEEEAIQKGRAGVS